MKILKHLFSGLFAACLFFLIGTATASAASIYSVTETSATVGTATNLEIEYTVDTAEQTWADADTLTIQLPANIPAWGGLTFTAEYDTDTTNDATGETAIAAGAGNGEYAVLGDTITIKWDVSTWGAVSNGASTIRILVTANAIPQYEDATSTFTFGGATADAGDTNPTGTDDVDVNPSDAASAVTLGANATVAQSANTIWAFTLPLDLAANDYIAATFPNNLNVASVAYLSDTLGGAGAFSCAAAGQVVTCTADGAITAAGGSIYMTGISAIYAATSQTATSMVIYDDSASANLSTDSSVSVTNTTAADAAATLDLGANATVGASGNTTLTLTTPLALAVNDTITLTMPSNLDISAAAIVSETFAGAGTFACAGSGQVLTCTASGAITAGTGTIIISGILATNPSSATTITDLAVNDNSNSNADMAADTSVTLEQVSGGGSSTTSYTFNQITGISVTDYSGGGVKITWTDPSGDDASYIDILRGVSPIPVSGTVYDRVALGVEEYIDTDLQAGDVVTYQLRGTNISTSGDLSAELTYTVGSGTTTTTTTSTETTTTTTSTETTTTTTSTDTDTDTDTTSTTTSTSSTELSDISGHWAADEINALIEEGIVKGNPDGTFKPDSSLNRAEAATLLSRILGGMNQNPSENPFNDVAVSAWYAKAVYHLLSLALIQGNPDGTFQPAENINRAEFLTMALNVYGHLSSTSIEATGMTDAYEDLDTDAWYAENVSFATEMGFVEGSACTGGMCFNADDEITRAEATAILYRIFATLL